MGLAASLLVLCFSLLLAGLTAEYESRRRWLWRRARSDGFDRVQQGLASLSLGLEEGEGRLWGELLAVEAEARGLGRKALAIGCG